VNIAKHGKDTYRVVGFEVEPLSIAEGENRLDSAYHRFFERKIEKSVLKAG